MKVLFIANYRDGHNGWSEAAQRYILALDSVGIDVVCRPIKLNNFSGKLPQRIEELESKDINNVDVSIQHVLPEMMIQDKRIPINIGMYYSETKWRSFHPWKYHLNKMDHIFLPNSQMLENHTDDKHKCTVVNVPMMEAESYTTKEIDIDIVKDYKFYWIGDLTRRKNLSGLLAAYYSTFSYSDNVSLIIKASKSGYNQQMIENEIAKRAEIIGKSLRIHQNMNKYPHLRVIDTDLNREELLGLHNSCDCLVYPSFGEGWGMVVADALALNNQVIANDVGGISDMKNIVGDNIKTTTNFEDLVIGSDHGNKTLYTGLESWRVPSSLELGKLMLSSYKNQSSKIDNSCIFDALSYQSIGQIMKDAINDIS